MLIILNGFSKFHIKVKLSFLQHKHINNLFFLYCLNEILYLQMMTKISTIYRTKHGEEYAISSEDFAKITSIWKSPVDELENQEAILACQKICKHIKAQWLYKHVGRRTNSSDGALKIAKPLWKKSPKEVSNKEILKACEDAGFKVSLGYLYINLKPRNKKKQVAIHEDKKEIRQLWFANPPTMSSSKIAKKFNTTTSRLERVFGKRQTAHNGNERLINRAVQSVKHLWVQPKTDVRTKEILYKSQDIYPNMTEFLLRNRLGKRVGVTDNKAEKIKQLVAEGKSLSEISLTLNVSRYLLMKVMDNS